MFRRLISLLLLLWAMGFIWFAIFLPRPAGEQHSDAVVVLTGGEGRIARGLEVLDKGWAQRLLVSGVDREVKPREFAVTHQVRPETIECCITLGFESFDTRSNAAEAARWISANKAQSIRLVTTDWHMRRAALELEAVIPADVQLIEDAVSSRPSFRILFMEYHKLLARQASRLWEG